jgi:hypothetical protein
MGARPNTAPGTFDGWSQWRSRRRRRHDAIELFGVVLAIQVLLLALYVQFRRGWFADIAYSEQAATATLAVAGATMVGLFIAPNRVGGWLSRLVHLSGSFIVDWLTGALLVCLYVTLWPGARLRGRRNFLRRHPAAAPWIDPKSPWRRSTWQDKQIEADSGEGRSRSALFRLLAYFVAQRNVFLLIITVIILVAVSVSVVSQTTYLAPFIYTFF